MDDEGFDFTNLTFWRAKLRSSNRPNRIFDAVKAVVDEIGGLAKKHRRALDSTILYDAVATQDSVTQIISAVRRAKLAVPELERIPLRHNYTVVGKPIIGWSERTERDGIVSLLVNDAIDSSMSQKMPNSPQHKKTPSACSPWSQPKTLNPARRQGPGASRDEWQRTG